MRALSFQRLQAFVVLSVLSMAGGLHLHQSCSVDSDCTQPSSYCYKTGKCVNCVQCSQYNRESAHTCAKDKNQCGSCLPGMEAESNFDGTFTCHPSGTLTPSTQAPGIEEHQNNTDNNTVLIVTVSAVILLAFSVCGYWTCKNKSLCVNIFGKITICPNTGSMCDRKQAPQEAPPPQEVVPPPPYQETNPNPSAPPFENRAGSSDERIFAKVTLPGVEDDPNQTANPFQCPTSYVRRGNFGTNGDPDDDPDEDIEASENDTLINTTTISQDDEETQPSTWTPAPGSETTSVNGPISFTGALSMDNLRISQPNLTVGTQQGSSNRSNSQPDFNFSSQNSPNRENPDSNIQVNISNRIFVVCSSNTSPTASK